ncbi:ArsR family transcriptional regulator [Salinigranum sp. GCM10025319]|uniref:ArsR family transcriptional regulator n=1 Tax=Salinigranum sp. GCM10025319 TaxID=3252687 RepID=UPI00360D8B64
MDEGTTDRARNDRGQYVGQIPLDDVVAVFEAREDRARPLTASDVMEELDCSRRTAHNKLSELVEQGALDTRKVGARSRVWWVPMGAEKSSARGDQSAVVGPTEEPSAPEDGSTPGHDSVSVAISHAELPGTGPTLEARRKALSAAYDYLTDHPQAKKADFLRDVYHDHEAGYESAEGWWNTIQPALKELPGVDPPEERGHLWHYLGG